MKYAVVTFGCRVNQADSLAVEAALTAAGADAVPCRSRRRRARQHLLGDRQRRPGRAPDDSPHPSREPGGAHRGHGLLRLARRRGGRGARRRRRWSCPTTTRPRLAAIAPPDAVARRCGRWSVRPHARARTDGPHRVDAARADRLRRAVQLLHHPDHARAEPEPHACPTSSASCAASSTPATRRSRSTGVHLGAWGRDLDGAAARWPTCSRRWPPTPGDFRVRVSSLEPMDCTPARARRHRRRRPDRFAAAPASAAAARVRPDAARRCVARTRRAPFARLVDDVRRRLPDAAIGSDVIVGFPGETDADAEALVGLPRVVAAHAPARVPVLRPSGDRGRSDCPARCTAPS